MKTGEKRSQSSANATPSAAVERIHRRVAQGAEVCSDLSALTPGAVYFALPRYRPDRGVRRYLWDGWTAAEISTPALCARLLRVLRRLPGPKSLTTRVDALAAEPLNGNRYAAPALAAGAGLAVVDTRRLRGSRFVYVPDAEQALVDVATYHRRRYAIPCVGVTGSCGKTTTKELLTAVLCARLTTIATAGNANTVRGVAHTVLRIGADTEAAVVEIASRGPDSVARKCRIAQPTLGVITAIGKAHLQGFGDLDNVVRIKTQLFDATAAGGGVVFVNLDDPRLAVAASRYRRVWTFGEHERAMTRGRVLEADPCLVVECDPGDAASGRPLVIPTRLFGRYNLNNVLAAVAVGRHLGIADQQIAAAIAGYEPRNHRSQIVRRGSTTFIVDAYNANPTSVAAALDSFERLSAERKTVILGDMLELGRHAAAEHEAILDRLAAMALDEVVVVGSEFARFPHPRIDRRFADRAALSRWIEQQDLRHRAVLIKGSQSIDLDGVVDRL